MLKLTTATVALALSCGIALAQQKQDQSSSSDQQGQANLAEQTFLKHAIDGNIFEIKASEAAKQQAQDDQVKKFADQMVQDHQQALDQLKQLAQSKGVQAPSDLSQPHQEELQALQSLQGKDFDQAYVSVMKADHMKDVSKYSDKAAICKDQEIKQFCSQLVPKLREHRQMVMQVAQAVGLPAGGGMRGEARQAGAKMEGDDPSNRSGSSDHSHGDHAAGSNSSDTSGGTSGGGSSGSSSGSSSQNR